MGASVAWHHQFSTVGTETLSVLAGPQGIRRTAQLPTAIITGAVTFIPCLSSAMGCRSLDASRPPLRLCLFFPHESARIVSGI